MDQRYNVIHGPDCAWEKIEICTCGLLEWLASRDDGEQIMPGATECVKKHRKKIASVMKGK
jgi:hypothetical protein